MDKNPETMDELRKDVLRELANIGSGHAATALAAMLGRPVTQSVPGVRFVPLAEMPELLGGAEKITVAGMLRIGGDFSGYLLLFFDFDQAEKVILLVKGSPMQRAAGGEMHRFSSMDRSVLSEMVNIIGGSYLAAVAELTGLKVNWSTPYLSVDMVGAVLSIAEAETGKTGDLAVMFESELRSETERIIGNLFLIPEENSCAALLGSLGFSE